MTDMPSGLTSVPSRLGVSARFDDGTLELDLVPQPQALHHGVLRASVVSFAIDAVAGIILDDDASVWTFTTDMSVRMRPVTAPRLLTARNTILRRGRRSAACHVEVTTDDGAPIATGALGFVHVPRKESDPLKPVFGAEQTPNVLRGIERLARPVREEAGIEVVDAAEGVVQVEARPEICNSAGTLQGAMVALLAEAAAEDLVSTRFESPVVVTDLDLRYLEQAHAGIVRTRSRLLGTGPGAPVEVLLVDASTDRITTHVYARATAVDDN